MSIDPAIDISSIATIEFATAGYVAEPVFTDCGDCIDLGSPTIEFATAGYVAEPVFTDCGDCIDLGSPTIEFATEEWRYVPDTIMNGTGVTLHFYANPQFVGDTGVVIGEGFYPECDFSGAPRTGIDNLIVHFLDESGVEGSAWSWNFGDDETSTEQNPIHFYASPGIYDVSLTVYYEFGNLVTTKTRYIQVETLVAYDDLPTLLTSTFTFDPESGKSQLPVQFTNTGESLDQIVETGNSDNINYENGGRTNQIVES